MRTYDEWKTTDDTYEEVDRCEQCGHPTDYCDCPCCLEPEQEEPVETIDDMADSVKAAIAEGWDGFAYMWACDLAHAAFREIPDLRK